FFVGAAPPARLLAGGQYAATPFAGLIRRPATPGWGDYVAGDRDGRAGFYVGELVPPRPLRC
ncbi:MAG: hypothetical protein FWC40_06305, partial [Proteobacteria bacterium]|nr:hypothetical protein [Pseudomonadota bacterium]